MTAIPSSIKKELIPWPRQLVNITQGFILTELLVCVVLSSVLVIGMINLYIGFKKQFLISHIKMEESSEKKFITNLLRHRIHHAGFTPCMNLKYLKTKNRFDENKPINSVILDQSINHILTIQRMSESFTTIRMLNS